MLLEIIVVGLCAGGYECNKAPQAYYLQNKELQAFVKNTETVAKNTAGPVVTNYVVPVLMPFAALATGQTARLTISKHWSLEASTKEGRFVVGWNW